MNEKNDMDYLLKVKYKLTCETAKRKKKKILLETFVDVDYHTADDGAVTVLALSGGGLWWRPILK